MKAMGKLKNKYANTCSVLAASSIPVPSGPKPKYTTGGVNPAIKNINPRIIFSLTTNSPYLNIGCN
jgi:hypothetical protein